MDGEESLLKLDLKKSNDAIIMSLNKIIDYKVVNDINKYLFPLLIKYDVKKVIIDLSRTKEINYAGFNIFIKIRWIMKLKNGKIYFLSVPKNYEGDLKDMNFIILNESKGKEVFI